MGSQGRITYHFKDVIERGDRPQKKVIAQQVEKVYPQAVSQRTNVLPDIYKKAPSKDGWVTLDTDLKVGDRVRIIGEKDEKIEDVLEIKKGAFQPEGAEAFVFGREVKDFRTVDYDAISMLNVSATQELAKKLEAKEAELNEVKAAAAVMAKKLSTLEEAGRARQIRDDVREARLNRLEARLAPSSDATARTVALKAKPAF
jgi:hypothetical protein